MHQHKSSLARESLWSRALRTPLSDLLRGRLGEGATVSDVASESTLAPPLKKLVLRVAKQTRLWPNEQLDVARELVAHFEDGREAGKSRDERLDRFGDVKSAARLIRRSKLRARPLLWRVRNRTVQAAGAALLLLLAAYGVLCLRFFSGSAELDFAQLASLANSVNVRFEETPDAELAWPVYEDVEDKLEALFGELTIDEDEDHESVWRRQGTGMEPYWGRLVELARSLGSIVTPCGRASIRATPPKMAGSQPSVWITFRPCTAETATTTRVS